MKRRKGDHGGKIAPKETQKMKHHNHYIVVCWFFYENCQFFGAF